MLEDEHALILAEWPDPIARLLPADRLEINFVLQEGDHRILQLASHGPMSQQLLEAVCKEK